MCTMRIVIVCVFSAVYKVLKMCYVVCKIRMRIYSGVKYCSTASVPGIWNAIETIYITYTISSVSDIH